MTTRMAVLAIFCVVAVGLVSLAAGGPTTAHKPRVSAQRVCIKIGTLRWCFRKAKNPATYRLAKAVKVANHKKKVGPQGPRGAKGEPGDPLCLFRLDLDAVKKLPAALVCSPETPDSSVYICNPT